MALSDSVRDTLISLGVVAQATGQLAAQAAENANDGNVQTDPLMSALRGQYLTMQKVANSVLTIDRPNTAGTRKTGSQIHTFLQALVTGGIKTQGDVDTAKAEFDAETTYSAQQVQSRFLRTGVYPQDFALDADGFPLESSIGNV